MVVPVTTGVSTEHIYPQRDHDPWRKDQPLSEEEIFLTAGNLSRSSQDTPGGHSGHIYIHNRVTGTTGARAVFNADLEIQPPTRRAGGGSNCDIPVCSVDKLNAPNK